MCLRNWGLGTMGDADTPELRDALVTMLRDTFEHARLEAIAGLAKRKDERVLGALMLELERSAASRYRPPSDLIESAVGMLNLKDEQEDWGENEHIQALRERFSL